MDESIRLHFPATTQTPLQTVRSKVIKEPEDSPQAQTDKEREGEREKTFTKKTNANKRDII